MKNSGMKILLKRTCKLHHAQTTTSTCIDKHWSEESGRETSTWYDQNPANCTLKLDLFSKSHVRFVILLLTHFNEIAITEKSSEGSNMYATKNPPKFSTTSSTATLSSVNNKVTRLFVDDTMTNASTPGPVKEVYSCRCTESKTDPTIMCPSHWLSFSLKFAPAMH